jgi:hypothetical protein
LRAGSEQTRRKRSGDADRLDDYGAQASEIRECLFHARRHVGIGILGGEQLADHAEPRAARAVLNSLPLKVRDDIGAPASARRHAPRAALVV